MVLDILQGEQFRYLSTLIRLLRYCFVSSSFLLLQIYFLLISACLMVSAANIPMYLLVFFSPSVLIFSWFGTSLPFVVCRFPLYIFTMVHFSMPTSIIISSIYFRWLIFSCDLLSLYPAVHFPCMSSSSIIAITNSNGDSATPWYIPLLIFASAKHFPPVVNSTFLVFIVFSTKLMDLVSGSIWGSLLSSISGPYHMLFYSQSRS